MTDLLREKIEVPKTPREKKTRKEKIIEQLITLAEAGDMAAVRYLFDRLDGRPKETVELANAAVDQKLREIMNEGT